MNLYRSLFLYNYTISIFKEILLKYNFRNRINVYVLKLVVLSVLLRISGASSVICAHRISRFAERGKREVLEVDAVCHVRVTIENM